MGRLLTEAPRLLEQAESTAMALAEMARQQETLKPIPRAGDPEQDIGGVALFLASEDSRYLTGHTLFVDGGSHINGVAWAPQLPD